MLIYHWFDWEFMFFINFLFNKILILFSYFSLLFHSFPPRVSTFMSCVLFSISANMSSSSSSKRISVQVSFFSLLHVILFQTGLFFLQTQLRSLSSTTKKIHRNPFSSTLKTKNWIQNKKSKSFFFKRSFF